MSELRVLTWNLFHGRSRPPAGRSLLNEFAAAIDGWGWDVALLQEVPPWWGAPLARGCGASLRLALTSRNWLAPVRRAVSARNPDLLKAGGGGSNAILVRGTAILEHRTQRLTLWPERRVAHGVRLADGTWAVNLHASHHPKARTRRDVERAVAAAGTWAGHAPLVLGGDFNLVHPEVPGLACAGSSRVDHVYARGLAASAPARRPDAGPLSDHRPLLCVLAAPGGQAATMTTSDTLKQAARAAGAHRVTTRPSTRHVEVRSGDVVLAQSRRPVELDETGLPTRFYLPPEDVRMDLLTRSDTSSHCPFKGDASYYSAPSAPDAFWVYEAPSQPEARPVAGLLAPWPGRVEVRVDGERVR